MIYMGSKNRISKDIVPIIQSYIDKGCNGYLEPFVGGANIIDKIECDNKIGSDINKYLISLLKRVKENLPLYDEVPKELYDKARTAFNNEGTSNFEDWEIGNIGFLASFNGRWFDGGYAKIGYEKTKNGERLRNYYQESKNNLLKQSHHFEDITFYNCDYNYWKNKKIEKFIIYCDPPYQETKQYANAISFDYNNFWEWCRTMSKKNIVLVSEQKCPNDFKCIWEKEVSRSINVVNKFKSTEKLFIYE